MARSVFGGGASDFTFGTVEATGHALMKTLPTYTVTFWSAKTGGTQYTDLLLASDGSGGAASSVVTDSRGLLPEFQGPDGVLVMWADAGTTRVKVTPANDYTAFVSVKAHGAVGNGTNDDTAAIQAAINAAAGGAVWFPPGIYGISGTLTVPADTRVAGPAIPLYPNFTTDWQTAVPSWASRAATIQRLSGNGAIFNAGAHTEFEGLVIRSKGSRTSADLVFSPAPSHVRFERNVVQNMYAVASDTGAAWAAMRVRENQFTGCTMVLHGILVDCKIAGNTFTSLTGHAFHLTSGAGSNSITDGNRFEWAEAESIRLDAGSRNNRIVGNIFDAHVGAGLWLNQTSTTDRNVISSNDFWRNGRGETGDYLDSHIRLTAARGHVIVGNTFRYGGPDSGSAWSGPNAVISVESCAGLKNIFHSNETRQGSKSGHLVVDRYSNSTACLDINSVDMPAGANPNHTTLDDLAASLAIVSRVAAAPTPCFIHENRYVTSYVAVPNVILAGAGSSNPVITNGSGNLGDLGGAHKVTYGSLAYLIISGAQYAASQPDGFRANGGWQIGQRVYNTAPAAGGTEGWMLITAGSPDTWKTFGVITA